MNDDGEGDVESGDEYYYTQKENRHPGVGGVDRPIDAHIRTYARCPELSIRGNGGGRYRHGPVNLTYQRSGHWEGKSAQLVGKL